MKFASICAMPAYSAKSFEEIRWEDYQDGVKGRAGGGMGSPAGAGAFGSTATPASTPFGAAQPAAAPAFGAAQPATTPAFGAAQPAAAPAFGAAQPAATPAFGAAQPAAAPAFGAAAPAFGAAPATTPAFGAPGVSATPTFGAPGAAAAPAFGAAAGASIPTFGAAGALSPTALPGGSLFGAAATTPGSVPTFGALPAAVPGSAPTTSLFGGAGAAKPAAPTFGAAAAAPAASTPLFGGAGAATPPTTSLFGGASTLGGGTPALGALPALGGVTLPKPGGTLGLGTPAAASTPSLFGGGSTTFGAATPQLTPGILSTTPGLGLGAAKVPAMQPAAGTPAPTTPFGSMPTLSPSNGTAAAGAAATPAVATPSGIAMAVRVKPSPGARAQGPTLAPRLITPRSASAARLRPRRVPGAAAGGAPVPFFSPGPSEALPASRANGRAGSQLSAQEEFFVARDNPRKLFIRDPVPSATSGTPASKLLSGSKLRARGEKGGAEASNRGELAGERRELFEGEGSPAATNGRAREGGATPSPQAAPAEAETAAEVIAPSPLSAGHKLLLDRLANDGDMRLLLPSLGPEAEDYYVEPSMEELARQARVQPNSLKAVPRFVVGRKGLGQVEYLEPVDVTGVPLDDIIQFREREVRVYMDTEGPKPKPGNGLNKPARVTLFQIFKTDKATGKVCKDEATVAKYEARLRKHAEKQGARFVSYQVEPRDPVRNEEGGEWTFEVDHFSRYDGNLLDSDSEEATAEEGGALSPQAVAAAAQKLPLPIAHPGLQAGLAAVSSDKSHSAAQANKGFRVGLLDEDLNNHQGMDVDDEAEVAELGFHDKAEMVATVQQILNTPAPPAPPVFSCGVTIEDQQQGVRADRALPDYSMYTPDRKYIDASKVLGRSFRAGWGPYGALAHVGHPVGGSAPPGQAASHVVLENVTMGSKVDGQYRNVADSWETSRLGLQARLQNFLEVHSARGQQDDQSGALQGAFDVPGLGSLGPLPCLSVACSPLEVEGLYSDYERAAAAVLARTEGAAPGAQGAATEGGASPMAGMAAGGGSGGGGVSVQAATILQNQTQTWQLLYDLLSTVDTEDPKWKEWLQSVELQWPHRGVDVMDMSGREVELQEVLQRAYRRKLLSFWFQDRAIPFVERSTEGGAGSPTHRALVHLCGRQISPAVQEVLKGDEYRLAPLLAYSGSSTKFKKTMQANLARWEAEPAWKERDPDAKVVASLLAGDVAPAIALLKLDWRQACGLHLWYSLSPKASLSDLVSAYEASVVAGAAPAPWAHFASRDRPGSSQSFDSAFELLRVVADWSEGRSPDGFCLARLLHPAGMSPEPLDCAFQWHLLTVLSGLGLVDPLADGAAPVILRAFTDMLGQLDVAGGLGHWAVYVAMHLPGALAARRGLVLEVLGRAAPDWAEDPQKRKFLQEVARVPPEWVAAAEAVYAQHLGDLPRELECLLSAGLFLRAHDLLVESLAPRLYLEQPPIQVPYDRLQESHLALRGYLRRMAPGAALIGDRWDTGAGVYVEYFRLHDRYVAARDGGFRDVGAGGQLTTQLEGFLARLDQIPADPVVGAGDEAPPRTLALSQLVARCMQWLYICTDGLAATGAAGAAERAQGRLQRSMFAARHSLLPDRLDKVQESAAHLSALLAAHS